MLAHRPPPDPGTTATTAAPWRPAAALRLHDAAAPGRAEVEDFIRTIYHRHYGARVRHFAPVLVSRHDETGEIVAAAGFRAGQAAGVQQPLFLERYLAAPVQVCLADGPQALPGRGQIVEVGHLAASRAGEGRRLIGQLGPLLARQGFVWVVGTLTQELRHLFVRLGIAPLALGVADPALLGDEAAQWGSYYDHRPVVLAGRLDLALQALARRGMAA